MFLTWEWEKSGFADCIVVVGFFSQINESLDTWQVPVCKSLGRSSIFYNEYQDLFFKCIRFPTKILAKKGHKKCHAAKRVVLPQALYLDPGPYFGELSRLPSRDGRWEQEWLGIVSSAAGKSYPTPKISKVFFAFANSASSSHTKECDFSSPDRAGHCLVPWRSICYLPGFKGGCKQCISTEVKYRRELWVSITKRPLGRWRSSWHRPVQTDKSLGAMCINDIQSTHLFIAHHAIRRWHELHSPTHTMIQSLELLPLCCFKSVSGTGICETLLERWYAWGTGSGHTGLWLAPSDSLFSLHKVSLQGTETLF